MMSPGGTVRLFGQIAKWQLPKSAVRLSIVIAVSPELSSLMAPASKVQFGVHPSKMTLGDPFHGNGKMLPAGRRPSAYPTYTESGDVCALKVATVIVSESWLPQH